MYVEIRVFRSAKTGKKCCMVDIYDPIGEYRIGRTFIEVYACAALLNRSAAELECGVYKFQLENTSYGDETGGHV